MKIQIDFDWKVWKQDIGRLKKEVGVGKEGENRSKAEDATGERSRLMKQLKIFPRKDLRYKALNKSDAVVETTTLDKEATEEDTANR